ETRSSALSWCSVMAVKKPASISAHEQLEHDLLRRSQRRLHGAPVRRTFLQGGTPHRPLAGPLALCEHDFLTVDKRQVRDLNSGSGWRTEPHYTRLWPPKTKATKP